MKKFMVTAILSISLLIAFAQSKPVVDQKDMPATHAECKNFIVMKDGIMILVKDGEAFAFNANMELNNGVSVRLNGTYLVNGHQKTFMDGDSIFLSGRIVVNKNVQYTTKAEITAYKK